jgi:nucleoside diphosphate kinase
VGEIIQRFEKKGYKLVGLKVGIKAPSPKHDAQLNLHKILIRLFTCLLRAGRQAHQAVRRAALR